MILVLKILSPDFKAMWLTIQFVSVFYLRFDSFNIAGAERSVSRRANLFII